MICSLSILGSFCSFFNHFTYCPFVSKIVFLPRKVDNPLDNQPQEDTMEEENQHVATNDVAEVDPGQDQVYVKTTSVVKSIVELNTGVQMTRPEEFVDLVKVSFEVFSLFTQCSLFCPYFRSSVCLVLRGWWK